MFQYLVLLSLVPRSLRHILFVHPGFRKPEALDIRVSMSSLVGFVTEEVVADSVRPPRFHLALAP